ncbi:MAG: hypothetical protein IIT64_05200, partial [Bacteroidaceae bacterium]|nr:hypothetical protein [Bacteroidaceae bacterium]
INLIFVAGNSIYYSNFKSFLSFSLLSTGSQLPGVMDAVFKNLKWDGKVFKKEKHNIFQRWKLQIPKSHPSRNLTPIQ